MGLGGPFGGFINDRCALRRNSVRARLTEAPHRFGWRWAFLSQLPLFAISLALTSWNLHYATPVRTLPRASRLA